LELVSVGGQLGIIFQRVAGVSMYRYVQGKPWLLFQAVRRLADLHVQLHRCAASPELPSLRERIAKGIGASQTLGDSAKQAALQRLAELPDGTAVCHGDFHPENIILGKRGPMIVDWESATQGDALGDVACTLRLMRRAALPPWEQSAENEVENRQELNVLAILAPLAPSPFLWRQAGRGWR
jgi:Ser/Thr protein kinase RdoA (MazF antagonist)